MDIVILWSLVSGHLVLHGQLIGDADRDPLHGTAFSAQFDCYGAGCLRRGLRSVARPPAERQIDPHRLIAARAFDLHIPG